MQRVPVRHPNAASSLRGNVVGLRGFTILELVVVSAVIFGLITLLLPAVMNPPGGGYSIQAHVAMEIRGLEAAISQFKAVYGTEPPSRIRLYETATGWASSHPGEFVEPITGAHFTHESERQRAILLITGIWKDFDFNNPAGWDINRDGSIGGFVDLTGSECLVFFLGGMPIGTAGGDHAMTGFSKNPTNPFAPATTQDESREGPFFEFKPSRLKPSLRSVNKELLVYVDPYASQTTPYLYASSYEGKGYDLADLSVGSVDDLNEVYRTGPAAGAAAQKAKTFQIISPGKEGAYGDGGYFHQSAPNNGLNDTHDFDNITNFHGGLLNQ